MVDTAPTISNNNRITLDSYRLFRKGVKLQAGVHIELGSQMEAKLLASDLLGKSGVFWSHLDAEIKAFQMHLVTTTYGEEVAFEGIAEC